MLYSSPRILRFIQNMFPVSLSLSPPEHHQVFALDLWIGFPGLIQNHPTDQMLQMHIRLPSPMVHVYELDESESTARRCISWKAGGVP